MLEDDHRFKGVGRTQNVSYMFQGVFEGGLEHVSLHVESIFETLPTKSTPWGRSATNFTFKGGGPKRCILCIFMYLKYLTFWYGPPQKSNLKGVVILEDVGGLIHS